MSAHNPPGSGCVIRCIIPYEEGNAHSHRWNGAEQARAETDVYKLPMDEPWRIVGWAMKKLKVLKAQGGLAGAVTKQGKKNIAHIKPFYRMFIPFPHNAHHIVPMGVLWSEVITVVVGKAKRDMDDMFNLVIGGFLTEPYNHNDRPNMITLPMRVKESKALGLPVHLAKKARNHPVYSAKIAQQVKAEIPPMYDDLAKEFNSKKHKKKLEPVQVKDALVAISKATYAAIISLAKANRTAGKTLDDTAQEIADGMVANLAK